LRLRLQRSGRIAPLDIGEGAIGKLIVGIWLAGAATVALAAAPPLFETLRWTAPGAELEALSTQPSACLSHDPRDKPLVQAGQALFNTPTLLGGQAAKAGLSCASCHINGRDNPHFMLAGVSDKAGTADVTNSFFSPARGNARFDPVPIPDLAVPGKISREADEKALEPFIRTLIVEEFAGHEPSSAMLDALAAYVRAIQNCPGGGRDAVARKLDDQFALIDAAITGAKEMAERDDRQAFRTLIAAARHQLGVIAERYAGSSLVRERALLLKASRELQALGQDPDAVRALANWQSRFNGTTANRLRAAEPLSLYVGARLSTLVAPQRESR
jgi:hypothetical protein